MQRLLPLFLIFAISLTAFAADSEPAIYLGGTSTFVAPETAGTLDFASDHEITFNSTRGKLAIPYAKITSYEYTREVARHLGIVAATIVPLVRKRERKHYIEIAYKDDVGVQQTVVFNIPKQMPRVLMAVLTTKAPAGCHPNEYAACPVQNSNAIATPYRPAVAHTASLQH